MRASVKMTAAASLAALGVALAAAVSPASAAGGTWHSGWRGAGIGWGGGAGAALAATPYAYAPRSYEYGNFDGDYGAGYYAFPGCPGRPVYDFWGNVVGATSAC